MTKTLIRGGCVLTLGTRTPNFPRADLLIDQGTIAEVGTGLRARDAEIVDATDAIVMPGFVDAHRHAWRSLFRNQGSSDGAAAGERYSPDDVYAATLIGLLGAAEAGITTVVDWCDVPEGDGSAEAALQAHADAGLRTVFVHTVGRDEPDADTAVRERIEGLRARAGSSTTVAVGSAHLSPADVAGVEKDWAVARELGLHIHAHAGANAGRGAVATLGAGGLLGKDVTLVHGSDLGDADVDAISSSEVSVTLTPAADMAIGSGSPRIQPLIDRDVRLALGVDDERVAPGDLFAQMRATISMQHATVFDLKLAGKAGLPKLMNTRDVIRYATIGGAHAAGLAGVTGSLEPRMKADVLILRTDRPNIFPVNDPIGAVVWGMDTSNVAWVFAEGHILMRDGVLEADVQHARGIATAARERVGDASDRVVEAAPIGEA